MDVPLHSFMRRDRGREEKREGERERFTKCLCAQFTEMRISEVEIYNNSICIPAYGL